MYYLIIKGYQLGPIPPEQLVCYNIDEDTLVWMEGWSEWILLRDFPPLQYLLPNLDSDSDSLSTSSQTDSTFIVPIQSTEEELKISQEYPERDAVKGFLLFIGVLLAVVVLAAFIYFIYLIYYNINI